MPDSHTIYKEKLLRFPAIFTEQLLFHSYLRTPSLSEDISAATERQIVVDRLSTPETSFVPQQTDSLLSSEITVVFNWLTAVVESRYNWYPVVVLEIRCR